MSSTQGALCHQPSAKPKFLFLSCSIGFCLLGLLPVVHAVSLCLSHNLFFLLSVIHTLIPFSSPHHTPGGDRSHPSIPGGFPDPDVPGCRDPGLILFSPRVLILISKRRP